MAGLYVHIPFCRSKCAYCDFYSLPSHSGDMVSCYVDALIDEYQRRKYELNEPVTTVYFGGGTPGVMPPALFDRLFHALPTTDIVEFTVETNPELITPGWLHWLKSTPVNRLSVGIQSLNDAELTIVGRNADARRSRQAMDDIAESHISNVSYDLIFGLPAQSPDSWADSLDAVLSYSPSHLSAYMLSWETGTRLDAMRRAGKVSPADDDTLLEMYDILCRRMSSEGFSHYEISNFAAPGCAAIHNLAYWEGRPYLGIGVAAHSFDGRIRRSNSFGIKEYLSGRQPVEEVESTDECHNSTLLTALRTSSGLRKDAFVARFGIQAYERLLRIATAHIRSHNMWQTDDALGFTERGWMLTDAILVDLFR